MAHISSEPVAGRLPLDIVTSGSSSATDGDVREPFGPYLEQATRKQSGSAAPEAGVRPRETGNESTPVQEQREVQENAAEPRTRQETTGETQDETSEVQTGEPASDAGADENHEEPVAIEEAGIAAEAAAAAVEIHVDGESEPVVDKQPVQAKTGKEEPAKGEAVDRAQAESPHERRAHPAADEPAANLAKAAVQASPAGQTEAGEAQADQPRQKSQTARTERGAQEQASSESRNPEVKGAKENQSSAGVKHQPVVREIAQAEEEPMTEEEPQQKATSPKASRSASAGSARGAESAPNERTNPDEGQANIQTAARVEPGSPQAPGFAADANSAAAQGGNSNAEEPNSEPPEAKPVDAAPRSAANESNESQDPRSNPSTRSSAERVAGRSSEPGTSEPVNTADRVRFVQRVASAVQAAGERGAPVRLRLSPPELGSLRLEITVERGVLTARLEAETSAARNLLLDQMPALRDRLAEHDLKIARFDVDLMDRSPGELSERPSQDAQFQQARGQRNVRSDRPAADAPVLTAQRAASFHSGENQLNVLV